VGGGWDIGRGKDQFRARKASELKGDDKPSDGGKKFAGEGALQSKTGAGLVNLGSSEKVATGITTKGEGLLAIEKELEDMRPISNVGPSAYGGLKLSRGGKGKTAPKKES